MQWIRPDIDINFVGMRYKAFLVSSVLILLSLAAMVWRGGLNLGVDFAGGTLVQIQFQRPTTRTKSATPWQTWDSPKAPSSR